MVVNAKTVEYEDVIKHNQEIMCVQYFVKNVGENILAFVPVYFTYLPPLENVKHVVRISEKNEVLENILWKFVHNDVENVKTNISNCILRVKKSMLKRQ